jgi:hypothetical protein
MSLTRQQAEEVLFRRLGPAMYRADMDTIHDGSNPNFADPLGWALTELGLNAPSIITQPTDTDLLQVTDAKVYEYLAVAEWRLLANIIGNLDDTDEKLGPTGMWNSQFAKQMQAHMEALEKRLMTLYGWGPPTLQAGTLRIVTVQEISD